MKQHHGGQKNYEVLARKQITDTQRRFELTVLIALFAATRQFMINFGGIDEIDDRGARDREEADQIEDPVITEGINQRSRHSRGDEVAAVVEALIAADPCIQAPVANEAKTERRKRRPDDGSRFARRHL